jgi:hypothetical protein
LKARCLSASTSGFVRFSPASGFHLFESATTKRYKCSAIVSVPQAGFIYLKVGEVRNNKSDKEFQSRKRVSFI